MSRVRVHPEAAAVETPMPLADAREREIIRTDLDRNLIAEAAAGTGKTSELVRRVVAVLARGLATVDRIVAVTFTEKAAGEIKLRVREGLERERREAAPGSSERRNLDQALARLEEAWVGTIHGFCAEILRERAVEARVDPEFEVMTDAESERAYRESFRLWLQEKLAAPPEGVRRSLRRQPRGGVMGRADDEDPIARLERAGWELVQWRDFTAPWRRDPFPREALVDDLVLALREFAAMTERRINPRDPFYLDTDRARALSREIDAAEEVRDRDYDGLEAELLGLLERRDARAFREPRLGTGDGYGLGLDRAVVLEARESLLRQLEDFRRRADADLAALLQHELTEVIGRYEAYKRRRGRLDFVDLLIRARDLVRRHSGVRAAFQRRFTHFFVDEFQDTDPVQAEILLLLASRDPGVADWQRVVPTPGKLFIVGDPKQSIYRFRRADVSVYQQVKELLVRHGAECLALTTSFRSVPAIQSAVNAAFSRVMIEEHQCQQSGYVPLTPFRASSTAGGQPSVVALTVPDPYGSGGITKTAVRSSVPRAVAAFIQWMLEESGWTVTEREDPSRRQPITARHVCLLFRRLDDFFEGDVTRAYVQQLEARGIRHLLVGGRSFHGREEVESMRTALAAIEWPDDELSVFATLRGPLFAVGDEELLEYRHVNGRLHPFRIPAEVPERLTPVTDSLRILATLHRRRNDRPIAETLHALLEETRAHAGFAFHPSGEQVLANVLHLAEQARAYERSGGISFRGFAEQLAADADEGKAAEAPILEEKTEGVRIMTVHKAKGLEFPVVILADITAPISRGQASRHTDPERNLSVLRIGGWSPVELIERQDLEARRDAAEGVRLAYVAATRARDLLVVPAVAEEVWNGGGGPWRSAPNWIAPLVPALYPDRAAWDAARPAPGCPPALRLSQEGLPVRPGVRPGLHVLDGYDVVWWDPEALDLETPPAAGIRQQELISKKADAAVNARQRDRFLDWQRKHRERLAAGSQASLSVRTATEQAAWLAERHGAPPDGAAGAGEVEVVDLGGRAGRPSGTRFGTLAHVVLASIPLDATEPEVAAVTALQGRILGATSAEIEAVVGIARRVLTHPLLERARGALARGQCRRETALTMVDENRAIVDGQVDLAFLEDGVWTVVDFKTDRELEQGLDVYRQQVALYARAVARATGQQARGVLLRV